MAHFSRPTPFGAPPDKPFRPPERPVFLIRHSKPGDTGTLLKLARMVYFINLPPDERVIDAKIQHSTSCFKAIAAGHSDVPQPRSTRKPPASRKAPPSHAGGMAATEHASHLFMFSIEDPDSGSVIGTSQVRAHQGGPGDPNWRMKLEERKFFSASLGVGTTHTTARLDGDETGPSEIGGLILQPSYRGHAARPGRFLSFVRFHFMGLHREIFADRVLAEMMAPVSSDGDNIFWDHIGRKFIPVKYAEADRFCQHNRQFIDELLPHGEIFLTLLPLEVLNTVGVVSRETIPARRMLESLGFKYRGFIDPFDGGPHLDAATDDIALVRDTRRAEVGKPTSAERAPSRAIVSTLTGEGDFRATECPCECAASGPLRLPPEAMELLGLKPGDQVGFTPLDRAPGAPKAAPAKKRRAPRRVGA